VAASDEDSRKVKRREAKRKYEVVGKSFRHSCGCRDGKETLDTGVRKGSTKCSAKSMSKKGEAMTKKEARCTEHRNEVGDPIRDVLRSRGLSPLDLAIVGGISEPVVYQLLRGSCRRIPKRILATLRELGCDTAALEKNYGEYRMRRREQLLTAVGGRDGTA
jgi:hypothetical protein